MRWEPETLLTTTFYSLSLKPSPGSYDQMITRTYETSNIKGRSTGFNIGEDYSVTYGYDGTGRFNSVAWNVAGSFNTATYSFVENSNLLQQLTTGNGLQTTYHMNPNATCAHRLKTNMVRI